MGGYMDGWAQMDGWVYGTVARSVTLKMAAL